MQKLDSSQCRSLNAMLDIIDNSPESFRDFCIFLYDNQISMSIITSKNSRTIRLEFSKKNGSKQTRHYTELYTCMNENEKTYCAMPEDPFYYMYYEIRNAFGLDKEKLK